MLKSFRGGVWLNLEKDPVINRPIETVPAPMKLVIPMRQHVGETAELCVKKGERVCVGQPLGVDSSQFSCGVHSSVSGKISDIIEYTHPIIGKCPAVVIENDGRENPYEQKQQVRDFYKISAPEILAYIRKAAIVSDGGFNTSLYYKLGLVSDKKINTLIINSVETEPYICRSQKIMDENPHDTAYGMYCLLKCTGAHSVVLAVSDDYGSEPDDFIKAAHLMGIEIKLCRVNQKYPSGHEKYLFKLITGESLKGKTPEDCGIGFVTIEDCYNVSRAVKGISAQITKIVTVAGDAVEAPQNLEIKIGTPIRDILDYCGLIAEPERVVLGSAMRGIAISDIELPVIKPVTAILALKGVGGRALFPRCINCGKCVKVCPQRLMPNYIAVNAVKADFEKCNGLSIKECIECGSCSFVCPGKVPIVELIKNIKKAGINSN